MAVKADVGQQFEFRAHQHGLYKFCFNNPGSTPETISFHIHVGHVPGIEDIARDGTSTIIISQLPTLELSFLNT